ncbi:hypothetical protein TNCV_1040451 [Trichonephila clavipes]|nr:hypothetical protein TNCV_1040451 [Trichonephila clavipes]
MPIEKCGTIRFETARECICVFRTNRTREAEGRLLCPANDKGRDVDPPLVFKRVFLEGGERLEPEEKGGDLESRDQPRSDAESEGDFSGERRDLERRWLCRTGNNVLETCPSDKGLK